MRKSLILLSILSAVASSLKLNVTAVGAAESSSTIECWQLASDFEVSTAKDTAGTVETLLSNAANVSYAVIPAGFDRGLHNVEYNQWIAVVTGLAYITLPEDNTTNAYIVGGEFGLVFASDIANVSRKGHRTEYPGNAETVLIRISTQDNAIPKHTVIHTGPCEVGEVDGSRGVPQ